MKHRKNDGRQMSTPEISPQPKAAGKSARDWVKILAQYREPNHLRSSFELAVTDRKSTRLNSSHVF